MQTDRTWDIIARTLPAGAFFDHAAGTTTAFASAGLVGIFPPPDSLQLPIEETAPYP